MSDEEKLAIIQRAKDLLCEHFEVGEILLQNHDPDADRTDRWDGGWGNQFARDRHISLLYQERVILHCQDEDEDEGDDIKSF